LSLVSVVSSVVKVSATGRSLAKRIPTESVCIIECDLEEQGFLSVVSVVSSLVKVSATGRSLAKRIPPESVCMCVCVS
jgi:hypothetical protein